MYTFIIPNIGFLVRRYFLPEPKTTCFSVSKCLQGWFRKWQILMQKMSLRFWPGNIWKQGVCPYSVYRFCNPKKEPNLSSIIRTYFTVNARSLKQFTLPYSDFIFAWLGKPIPTRSSYMEMFEGRGLNMIYRTRGNNKSAVQVAYQDQSHMWGSQKLASTDTTIEPHAISLCPLPPLALLFFHANKVRCVLNLALPVFVFGSPR